MDKKHIKVRNKYLKGILIILAVIMVIGSFSVPSFATEIDHANEEKTKLEKKKEETETRILELEKDKDDILKYIEKLDMELNKLSDDIDALNGDIDNAKVELVSAQEELELARVTEENQYSIMKKRIKYMYEHGDADYLDLIAQSESLADVLNQVEYSSKITEYDNSLLDKYTALKRDVIKKEKVLETKLATLKELKDELDFEQVTVERLATDKNKELIKYENSITKTQSLSAEYTSKLEEQDDIIDALIEAERIRVEKEQKAEEERKRKAEEERLRIEAETASNNNTAGNETNSGSDNGNVSTGNFVWPVPTSGRITSTFGNREQPTEGASAYHKGLDIGASSGSNIVAAAGGTVTTATYSVSAGNFVMISHGNGLYTVYMHSSKLLVSVGEQVNQGEVIALVGSTGFSTGAHLHFGVMKNGTYVNPQDYVSY